MKPLTILAIETSCDDTSIALIECNGGVNPPTGGPKFKIIESLVSSQISVHRPFGGVVPNLAKREHLKNLPILWKRISKKYRPSTINQIAVTVGPGLEPALWTGITFAQELATKLKKPLIGINHLEGHLYSNLLTQDASGAKHRASRKEKIKFPSIALIVSGGHTILLKMGSQTKWKKLGETLDDAAGEAFDKVAKMLHLPYPGGPEIEKLAKQGNPQAIKFPRPMLSPKNNKRENFDLSFSGLKTSVLYYLRDNAPDQDPATWPIDFKANVAASFQQAVIDVLVKKTIRAAQKFKTKSIMISGGVSSSKALREFFIAETGEINLQFFAPEPKFNTDNAAMIAAAAYINILRKNKKRLKIEAQGDLTI